MTFSGLIKNLLVGFWEKGFIELVNVVRKHWIITFIIIAIISYLCSNPETSVIALSFIGIFAVYTAIKSLWEIIVEVKHYFNSGESENKDLILKNIGGRIFDFSLCVIGVFQVLKIFSHISKITKSSSSMVGFVDDTASTVSKILQYTKNNINK